MTRGIFIDCPQQVISYTNRIAEARAKEAEVKKQKGGLGLVMTRTTVYATDLVRVENCI